MKLWTTVASSTGLHLPTPSRLYKNSIDVQRLVAQNLMLIHTAVYKQNVLLWKGQNYSSPWTMSKGTQLLTSNKEGSMRALRARETKTDEREHPTLYKELISFIFL